MPIYLALGVVVTLLLIQLGRWFVAVNAHDLARGLRWAAIGLGALLAIALLVTEQFGLLLLLAAGSTVLMVTWRRRRLADGGTGRTASPSSVVDTTYLHMELHHASGVMTGGADRPVLRPRPGAAHAGRPAGAPRGMRRRRLRRSRCSNPTSIAPSRGTGGSRRRRPSGRPAATRR